MPARGRDRSGACPPNSRQSACRRRAIGLMAGGLRWRWRRAAVNGTEWPGGRVFLVSLWGGAGPVRKAPDAGVCLRPAGSRGLVRHRCRDAGSLNRKAE